MRDQREGDYVDTGRNRNKRNDWETPDWLFKQLHREFIFTLDAAANSENAKCNRYFTEEENRLEQQRDGAVWVNPPYKRYIIDQWVEKGLMQASLNQKNKVVVMLVPSNTASAWFQTWAMGATEIRLIRGRIKFKGAPYNAPFPSAVLIFDGKAGEFPRLRKLEKKSTHI